jgi:Outer membrane lipoprotein-sorting protein
MPAPGVEGPPPASAVPILLAVDADAPAPARAARRSSRRHRRLDPVRSPVARHDRCSLPRMRPRAAATIAIVSLLGHTASATAALEAAAILARARAAVSAGGNLAAEFRLEVVTRGWTADRRGRFYKRIGTNGQATLIVFDDPPQVHDVKILSRSTRAGSAQRWLWVPATHRARRVATGTGGRGLFGSDFSASDLEQRGPDVHGILLRREMRRDRDAYVVELTGREDGRPVHEILWVRSDDFRVARREFYEDGALRRVYTADRIRTIDGIPTPVAMTVVNLAAASRSRIRLHRVRHGIHLDPRLFTVAELERRLTELDGE